MEDTMEEGASGGRLSAADYRTIFDNASDGFLVHPPDSAEILEVNRRLTELLGYSREELLDMRVPDITADDWDPPKSATERIQQAREEGQVKFEWRDQRKDGTPFWVEVNLTLVDLDGGQRVLSSVREIEERKRQERRARAIFDQTYQFTGLMEPDGTLVEANQTALEFGDLDRSDVIGKPVWDCYWFAYSSEIQQQARQAVRRAADGEFVRQNLEVRGSGGTETIDFSIRPVTDERGAVTLLIPEGRVITERLQHRERLRAYNRIMRHNLRNQLTSINGYATRIGETTDDPDVARLADRVLGAGGRLERLAEQIREFDGLREGEPPIREVAVAELLDELAAEYDGDGTTVRVVVDGDVAVRTDPRRLRLVLWHLLDNAVEHGGPTVRLGATAAARGREPGVEFTVHDGGPGIPEREYEPVLEGTSDPLEHATRIGLLIVRWGVDDLGGDLDIDSDPEHGTTVRIWLPAER